MRVVSRDLSGRVGPQHLHRQCAACGSGAKALVGTNAGIHCAPIHDEAQDRAFALQLRLDRRRINRGWRGTDGVLW